MKYKLNFALPAPSTFVPPLTGAQVSGAVTAGAPVFLAWQPSTWPAAPNAVDERFVYTLKAIFEQSILFEIENVIKDAQKSNGDLQYRGHVVAIAMLCALDAISSYGYGAKSGAQIPEFIEAHFSPGYHAHAQALLYLYRHALVHSWNLFQVAILPGKEKISAATGILEFGLLEFFNALVNAVQDFLERLENETRLHANTLTRYKALKATAKS